MLGFAAKQTQPAIKDRVIVFDDDAKMCEILPVDEANEEVIKAGNKVLPRADITPFLSKQGRVYVFRAPGHIVQLTEHLARVEKNTIIRQIAQYTKPYDETKLDWQKIALLAGLIIVAIVAAVK